MNRLFAFLCAVFLSSLSIASACVAQPSDWIRFTLEPARDGKLRAEFRNADGDRRRDDNNWSTSFHPPQLLGLEVSTFRSAGTHPLHFAVSREAGRLDCSGQGGSAHAAGNCRFTPDPRFMQLLASRGIARPTHEEAFGLMAIDARREVVEALAASRYPTPTVGDLMALTALGVDGSYIRDLAQAGYRPTTIDTVVQFKALNITPEFIRGFVRRGYGNVAADELVQLRALDISADYIAGFERLGYRNLPVNKLVELKALGITPEFVVAMQSEVRGQPSVGNLVERKIFGRRR
jgi:hypothetical protein